MKNRLLLLFVLLPSIVFGQFNYRYYSKAEVESDIDYLSKKVCAIHPLMLKDAKIKWWNSTVQEIKNELPDSLTQNECYLLMANLMTNLEDGHSGVQIPFDQRKIYTEAGGLVFPFYVKIQEGSLYVDYYCGNDSTLFIGGEEILNINGINVKEIIEKMEIIFGDKSSYLRQKQIASYFRFLIWIVYGWEGDYDLLITNSKHRLKHVKVPGVTSEVFLLNKNRNSQVKETPFSLELDESNSIALMTIRSFGNLDQFCTFADSAFALINNKGLRNLIIDVRDNGGGRSIVVDSLMNYITDQSYAQYKLIETRVSNELLEYYRQNYPEKYEMLRQSKSDSLNLIPVQIKIPPYKSNRFVGDLYLLINKGTASAASTFAGVFKNWNLGTIVGEETGGKSEFYGDYWFQETPITKISFFVAPKKFTQFGGDSPEEGVKPDYNLLDKKNMILNFAYDLILYN
nr:S41 family peptidase [uncultured Carboxylicivirga sp.]